MSLTGILFLIVLALFIIMIKFVIDGYRTGNWKKVVLSISLFAAILLAVYFGLIHLITSM